MQPINLERAVTEQTRERRLAARPIAAGIFAALVVLSSLLAILATPLGRARVLLLAPPLALLYVRVIRPWQLRWGATDEEIARSLPGDDLVAKPTFNATRAITIAAPPHLVWPWLVQVGVTRAGWYSYDLLDNLGRPSAHTIIPELQDLKVGDVVPMSPDGRSGPRVLAIDPGRSMIWGAPGEVTWVWVLEPRGESGTRLVTRIRIRYRWLHPTIAFNLLVEFADIVMIRRMLLNLKERAEGLWARPRPPLTLLNQKIDSAAAC